MTGKIFLILGASSDLGLELIKTLDEKNADCLFLAHYNCSKEKLEKMELHGSNKIECIQADLSNMQQVDSLISQVKEFTAAPTHIVHLAALPFKYMKLKEFNREAFIKNMDVQVCSFAKIMQAFLPTMAKRKQHDKVVVMLTSYLNGMPPKFMEDYIITKYALLGLFKSIASDYSGKQININAVSPSMIETKFLKNIDERIVKMTAEKSPEGRNAMPSDVIPVIKFLLSDDSNYIHGQNISVNNGEN